MNEKVLRKRALQLAASKRHADLTKKDMAVLKGLINLVPWSGDYGKAVTDIVTDREPQNKNGKPLTLAGIARRADAMVVTVKAALPRLVKAGLIGCSRH